MTKLETKQQKMALKPQEITYMKYKLHGIKPYMSLILVPVQMSID